MGEEEIRGDKVRLSVGERGILVAKQFMLGAKYELGFNFGCKLVFIQRPNFVSGRFCPFLLFLALVVACFIPPPRPPPHPPSPLFPQPFLIFSPRFLTPVNFKESIIESLLCKVAEQLRSCLCAVVVLDLGVWGGG